MPSALTRARPALAFLWAAGLLATAALLHRPSPLFVNLGAGDEPFTHGFRSRWEREGRRGNPHTTFRWTEDGAHLRLPFATEGAAVRLRLRLARFAPEPAEITLLSSGREVDRWTQDSRGFHVREVHLGRVEGTLDLQFRSSSADEGPLGVALDWVEIHGVGALRPPAPLAARALALLLTVPLLAVLVLRGALGALGLGAALAWSAAAGALVDRLGTLLALVGAAVPALGAGAVLLALFAVLRRSWPDQMAPPAVLVPLGAAVLWLALVFHPFYYYPDVERHGVLLDALRANPGLLADPAQPWPRQVTREIGGQEVALPYAFAFHASAWPLAPWLGDAAALKTMGVSFLGATLLLVFPLARAAALGTGAAVLAQLLAAVIPVSTARVALALYPTLLGQAAFVLLLCHLARRLSHLEGARDAAAATAFFVVAQAVYTGSLISVGALVLALALLLAAAGERRRTLRLLGAWGTAATLVLLQYAGFFPVLWRDVLPHVGGGPAALDAPSPGHPLALAAVRLGVFFDAVYPLLTIAGLAALRGAGPHVRRVLGAALAGGLALAVLRFLFPTLLSDAKEVEMMVAPVAVASAGALAFAWRRGPVWRPAAVVGTAAAVGWGAWRSALFYADRFTAAGR